MERVEEEQAQNNRGPAKASEGRPVWSHKGLEVERKGETVLEKKEKKRWAGVEHTETFVILTANASQWIPSLHHPLKVKVQILRIEVSHHL